MKSEIKPSESLKKKTYISPDINVVEIEIEQNILADASGGMKVPGEPW